MAVKEASESRPGVRQWASILVVAATAVVATACSSARSRPDPEKLTPIKVQDLHYGDVLFHFYAEEDFEALTRLKAYENWNRMPNHAADADLLAGGLYLSLGMHNEAGTRFEHLLTENVPVGVRNRAWYYLAKVWYTRGYYPRSEAALAKISGKLSNDLEAERLHLLVNVLMQQGRFDEAVQKLNGWQGRGDWMAYARFNLGVALVRQNRLAEADPFLTAVGTLNVTGEELLALRDKANVALGYAHLQVSDPAPAQVALARVRLDGPYASKALLGAGWASAAQGDYKAALTPWLELHQRNLLDAAVQESYLSVPYAFSQLGAAGQSAEYYEAAIKDFGSESDQLDSTLVKLGSGGMLTELLKSDDGGQGWFWQLKQLPDAPQSRYLYTLLADNDFQEGLKNFRDLASLDKRLGGWRDSMDAFAAMIDTREKAYAEKLPATDALLATKRPGQLVAQRAALDTELGAIETADDVPALGPAAERAQWARVRELEENLKALPDDEAGNAMRDKLRLIKGVLYWHFDEQFKSRDYDARRQLRELDAALNEAQNRWVRVQKARSSVPMNTGEFARRVAALSARLDALRGQLASASVSQDRYLEALAAEELNAQKDRLAAYQVQARFALADIYDRSASGPNAPSGATPSASDAPPGDQAPSPAGAPLGAPVAPGPMPAPTSDDVEPRVPTSGGAQ